MAGETSYQVQYWNSNSSSWVTLGSAGANVTSARITSGLGFYFRIGATNAFGTSWSPFILAQ